MEAEPQIFGRDDRRLVWGDTLDVLPTAVADGTVDLIFADPPYNIGKTFGNSTESWPNDEAYVEWCRTWLEICFKKLAPHGTLYLMSSTQAIPFLDIYVRRHLTILSRIIWYYDSSGKQARNYYGSRYEPILHCVQDPKNYVFNAKDILVEAKTGSKRKLIDYRGDTPKPYNTEKVPGNVWQMPRVRYRMSEYEEHPTQKPEALLRRIILASSNPGDLVLDPFSGSFTTGAVALRLQRRFIGIEQEREYCKIGLRRLGIADHFEGERLSPPEKSFRHKSRQGDKGEAEEVTVSRGQQELF